MVSIASPSLPAPPGLQWPLSYPGLTPNRGGACSCPLETRTSPHMGASNAGACQHQGSPGPLPWDIALPGVSHP